MTEIRKALVVDGEGTSLHVMALLVRAEGYAAKPVGSATEALRCQRDHSFDLILATHDMRPVTGLDLWNLLRDHLGEAMMPFVLVASAETQARLRYAHPALPTLLQKPFNSPLTKSDGADSV